jgi:hypothetical protein
LVLPIKDNANGCLHTTSLISIIPSLEANTITLKEKDLILSQTMSDDYDKPNGFLFTD